MNLVAKEFVAANAGDGVLVLSRGAGAAVELGADALLAEPYDVPGLAATLGRALAMPASERRSRIGRLSEHVRRNDVHGWASQFLETLGRSPTWAGGSAGARGPRSGVWGTRAGSSSGSPWPRRALAER
jgi:trehalose 6-phosphate synthase